MLGLLSQAASLPRALVVPARLFCPRLWRGSGFGSTGSTVCSGGGGDPVTGETASRLESPSFADVGADDASVSAYPLQGSVVDTLASWLPAGGGAGFPRRSHARRSMPNAFHGSTGSRSRPRTRRAGALPLPPCAPCPLPASAARTSGGRSTLTSPQRRRLFGPKHSYSSCSRMPVLRDSVRFPAIALAPSRRPSLSRKPPASSCSSASTGTIIHAQARAQPGGMSSSRATRGPEAQEHVHDQFAVSYARCAARDGSARNASSPRSIARPGGSFGFVLPVPRRLARAASSSRSLAWARARAAARWLVLLLA